MKFKDSKLLVLKALYDYRFDSGYFDIQELSKKNTFQRGEAVQIGRSLEKEGYIRMTLTKSSVRAKIEPLGIEYIEDEKFIESTYDASDTFSIEEKIAIIERIDKLSEELKVIKLAQEFTYNDLYDELEELKVLLSVLGKKNWTQILKGKMVDAGLGFVLEEVTQIIVEVFKNQDLIGK